jgi:opacity protein-like surface antigen
MRALPPVLLAAAALAAASPARAREAVASAGPIFALRAGLGVPTGDIARGGPEVRDVVEYKIPLGLEIGYRFGRRIWGELVFELAPAGAASGLCAAGADCFASDARIALALLLRLAPRSLLDPWVGVGVGVEVMNARGRNSATSSEFESSWAGLELPLVEAGVDVAVSDRVAIGPWASFTVARFTSESVEAGGGTTSGKIQDRAAHGWLSGGLKATLKL